METDFRPASTSAFGVRCSALDVCLLSPIRPLRQRTNSLKANADLRPLNLSEHWLNGDIAEFRIKPEQDHLLPFFSRGRHRVLFFSCRMFRTRPRELRVGIRYR